MSNVNTTLTKQATNNRPTDGPTDQHIKPTHRATCLQLILEHSNNLDHSTSRLISLLQSKKLVMACTEADLSMQHNE